MRKSKTPKAEPTPETLATIEEFGRLLFTWPEIEILTGDTGGYSPAELAYHKGRLMAEAEVRKSILKSASTGSAPAQKQYMELVSQLKRANRRAKESELETRHAEP